jgi:hypothetical protein
MTTLILRRAFCYVNSPFIPKDASKTLNNFVEVDGVSKLLDMVYTGF